MLESWGWTKAILWERGPQRSLKSCTGRLPMDQAFPLAGVSLVGRLPKLTPPWILGMRDRLWEMGHCLIWFPQRVFGQGQEAGQGSHSSPYWTLQEVLSFVEQHHSKASWTTAQGPIPKGSLSWPPPHPLQVVTANKDGWFWKQMAPKSHMSWAFSIFNAIRSGSNLHFFHF